MEQSDGLKSSLKGVNWASQTQTNPMETFASTARTTKGPISFSHTGEISNSKATTPLSPTIMMWNIKDCHVGYDLDMAKQFKLEGCDNKYPIETLAKLNVDADIPYTKSKRLSHQLKPINHMPMAKTMTAWSPTSLILDASLNYGTNTFNTLEHSLDDMSPGFQYFEAVPEDRLEPNAGDVFRPRHFHHQIEPNSFKTRKTSAL